MTTPATPIQEAAAAAKAAFDESIAAEAATAAAQLSPVEKMALAAKQALKNAAAAAQGGTPPAPDQSALDGRGLSRASTDAIRYAELLRDEARLTPDQIVEKMVAEGYQRPVAEAALAGTGTAPAPATETADDPLVVELAPGMAVQFDDLESAAAARAGVMHRQEFHAARSELERDYAEVQVAKDLIDADPVGFVLSRLDPELKAELEERLHTFEPAQEMARSAEVDALVRSKAIAREQARRTRDAIDSMIPASMSDEQAALARNDLVRDVADFLRQRPEIREAPIADLPQILSRRLQQLGIDPNAAAAAIASGRVPVPRNGRMPSVEDARATGTRLKQAAANRRELAAVPGAGAGARPAKVEIPAQQGVKERISTLRKMILGG